MTTQSVFPPISFRAVAGDAWLVAELRSDHAGEYGAVIIYDAILAISRDPDVRAFAARHRVTEREHLAFFEDLLPRRQRTRLLPLWRVMAWTLGALAALGGPRAVYTTIVAVETFVEGHYQRQIDALAERPALAPLRERLREFCNDEVEHRDDAGLRHAGRGPLARYWSRLIDAGSRAAVAVARRL